ncbi:MAG: transcriptional regulator, partial [Ilumatobacteraceae bacterium]|nr:transcriptional regulator [Ilumatobacteraceae bacterium]
RAPAAPPVPEPRAQADRLAATAVAPGGGPGGGATIARAVRTKPPMWRRITFALVLIGLVAAIPVLGYKGYQLVSDSTQGEFAGTTKSPTDPGYEAQVEPTPTAVAIQYDDQHEPVGLTFLSLAGGEGGGSVIFVPLDTEVSEPSFGVDRLRTAYEVVADRPIVARERLASQVGRLLNVGVNEIIDLDNAGWEQLVASVAPLAIDNPDQIDLGFGQVIPSGKTTLNANQVGLYLAATVEGESDLNRLARHEAVWTAWLEQLAESGKAEAVPGESTAGISKFAQALAGGDVTFDTLPVNSVPGLIPLFRIDEPAVDQLITDTVASPTAAVPGSRFTVRLLNGVSPDGIPSDIVRQVVGRGGAVTILGNGPEFGTDETSIVYANPADRDLAKLVAASLGATGKVRLDREAPDTVDLTIVLGKDVLGDATGSGTPGATTPETTAAGGD